MERREASGDSSLPLNGARAAEDRVLERLAQLRSSGAEQQELTRRVLSYRKGRPKAGPDGQRAVYYVEQNLEPLILKRTRQHSREALYIENNMKYGAERERVMARREVERVRQEAEHIASRDRQELKRQVMRQARIRAAEIRKEKKVMTAVALSSRMEVIRAKVEHMRLSRLIESGRDRAIRKLQNAWRTIRIEKSESLLGDAARVIQRAARLFLWRNTLKRKIAAANKIIEYTRLCGVAGGFAQMLGTYRARVIYIQRMWKMRTLTNSAVVMTLINHWDRAKAKVGATRSILSGASKMVNQHGRLTPEMEARAVAVLPSILAKEETPQTGDGAGAATGKAYPTKSLKDRRQDEKNEALALKHALLGKIEGRLKSLPSFGQGKEPTKVQKKAAIEQYVKRSKDAHRVALREYHVLWAEYADIMVGVERQLVTRRALGASVDIGMPPRPAKPKWKLFPRDEDMWAVISDCEKRAKKGGGKNAGIALMV